MKTPPHQTAVPCRARAGSQKLLSNLIIPQRPHTRLGKLEAQSCTPVQWLLLLIVLCPLLKAFGMGLPVPGEHGPTNILLNTWSFTDTTNWTSAHGYPPVSFTNLSVSDLGAGTAVVVDSPNPAWLQYNIIENDGTTNLSLSQGSVIFWFAPNWAGTNEGGTGPGSPGRLIEVGAYTEDASYGWWSLHTDAEGVNLYFSAQGSDGCETNYLCAPIDWTTNRWHLIALTYSCTNSALYLDGELATNGPPITCLPGAEALANGFFIGSSSNGTAQAHGMFDSLATYANPVDAGTVASTFRDAYPYYYLNPLNRASWASAPSYITNTPNFRAISGPGYLEYVGAVSACATNSNVWITNVTATPLTNGTTTLSFTIMGGDPSQLYDAFGTGELVGNNITNAQWAWLGQGPPCSNYEITNLPFGSAFIILGTPQDSDNDGLTDAYELLVSHTDPHNPDTDGDGIMDWFGPAYFGTSTLDPYALCPSGDGWTLLQAYQNGWDPLAYYTPPPPQNVVAVLDSSGTTATVTWQSGGGPVASYAVYRDAYLGGVDSTVFSFKDSWSTPPDGLIPDWTYFVRAYFTNGAYADSQPAGFTVPRLSSSMAAVRGPAGQLYLVVGSVPADLASVRIVWSAWDDTVQSWVSRSLDLSASDFVNGAAALPPDAMTGYDPGSSYPGPTFAAQCISTDGQGGAISYLTPYAATEGTPGVPAVPPYRFVDTRSHLKENLKFLLQAATLSQPFSYISGNDYDYGSPDGIWSPETAFARPPSPASYEYSGFHVFSSNLNYSVMQEFRPAQENYLWRNFAYDSGDFNSSGTWLNGVGYDLAWPGLRWLFNPSYQFTATNADPIPLGFSSANYQNLYARWVPFLILSQYSADIGEVGVLLNTTNHLYVPSGLRNVYGLPVNSVLIHEDDYPATFTLAAGGSPGPRYADAQDGDYFPGVQSPVLETVDYYFASQTPYLSHDNNGWSSGPLAGAAPPLPGSPTFSVTNTSPLLITGLGQPMTVSGWAKQAITNGYSGTYAYLEQYFTNAYTIDGSGKMTTNSAGLLSPYGEFFPMQPGPAALLTLPDIDPPYQRGTGVVNVIKLQLDVNHDGNMDLSFAGPDNTSQARPYQFWLNSNYDRWNTETGPLWLYTDTEQDDQQTAPTSDCNYSNCLGGSLYYRAIPCTRDLEDFARLWVCGVTSNLLAALPAGTTVTLSWGDVGNPNTNNPTIDLFQAADPDGGIGYLTNETTATLQTNNYSECLFIGRLGPGQSIQLNSSRFAYANNWAGNYFIWCGVGAGAGALTLTIAQGTNTLAQTASYIQLQDIKMMYERRTVGDNENNAPTNTAYLAEEGLAPGVMPFQSGTQTATDTPYILFVHGFNLKIWQKDGFAETAFKRLYWQGYQGRFGTFRWPTTYTPRLSAFDNSEIHAWQSAAPLLNVISNLNAQSPGNVYVMAHSHGAVVAGEALRLAGANQLVNTYVAMQAALDSHTYDPTTPARPAFFSTPDRYGQYYTNGAPGYFNGVSGAGTYVNFFNPNDWALSAAIWQQDQNQKPDGGYGYSPSPEAWWQEHFPTTIPLVFPQDTYKIFSFCDQAHGFALGAQLNVAGPYKVGISYNQVELDASPYNFTEKHIYHSGEFRSDYAQRWQFWNQVLIQLGLKKP